jgi:hypothetical protein
VKNQREMEKKKKWKKRRAEEKGNLNQRQRNLQSTYLVYQVKAVQVLQLLSLTPQHSRSGRLLVPRKIPYRHSCDPYTTHSVVIRSAIIVPQGCYMAQRKPTKSDGIAHIDWGPEDRDSLCCG